MIENLCVFEDNRYSHFYPLALSRPVFDLRCGMMTLKEKICRQVKPKIVRLLCRDYLQDLVAEQNEGMQVNQVIADSCLFVNGRVLADSKLNAVLSDQNEQLYFHQDQLVAAFLIGENTHKMRKVCEKSFDLSLFQEIEKREIEIKLINYIWELIHHNASEIESDFSAIQMDGNISGRICEGATLLNKKNIFIGENTQIKPGVVIDAENGPIYIGRNVKIMANAVIEGPVFVGDNSSIKIGAKIYEGTSIGEVCKVGGEVEESIIHSYSNKQHDGFLGHAYLGQWVNLGADTNNSDLKNNYGNVKIYMNGEMIDSGSMFVGLFMGDHSKAGINTMFNTGTVVGVMSNIFGGSFPPKFIPSFAWGGPESLTEHHLEKSLVTAKRVMSRRKIEMSRNYERLFRNIFELTQIERKRTLNNSNE